MSAARHNVSNSTRLKDIRAISPPLHLFVWLLLRKLVSLSFPTGEENILATAVREVGAFDPSIFGRFAWQAFPGYFGQATGVPASIRRVFDTGRSLSPKERSCYVHDGVE